MKITYTFQICLLTFVGVLLVFKNVFERRNIIEPLVGSAALGLATRNAIQINNLRKSGGYNMQRIKMNKDNINKNRNRIKMNIKDIGVSRYYIDKNEKEIARNRKEIARNRRYIIGIKKLLDKYKVLKNNEDYQNNIDRLKVGTCNAEKNAFMSSDYCMETPDSPECDPNRSYQCKAFSNITV